jgi:hypothetical protein
VVHVPERGSSVVLRSQEGAAHLGTVTALSPGRIAFELEDDHDRTFMIQERVLVTWPDNAGVMCLPTVIIDVPLYDDRLWLAQATGDPWSEQRREFIRAAIIGTVALRRTDSLDIAIGELIDLSEAGLRCSISERHADLAEPGTEVTLSVVLDQEEDFQLSGKVLYGRHAARADGRLEFVVIFDRPIVQVERLRFHIGLAERKGENGAQTRFPARPEPARSAARLASRPAPWTRGPAPR